MTTDAPRCPICGYTKADCALHLDHHLCNGPGPAARKQPAHEIEAQRRRAIRTGSAS